jgi:hypothetical protein
MTWIELVAYAFCVAILLLLGGVFWWDRYTYRRNFRSWEEKHAAIRAKTHGRRA